MTENKLLLIGSTALLGITMELLSYYCIIYLGFGITVKHWGFLIVGILLYIFQKALLNLVTEEIKK